MTATRSRKEEVAYKRYLTTPNRPVCEFCVIKKGSHQFVEQSTYFKVIKNNFPYSIWDGQLVESHLMVTPKRHTDTLDGMEDAEKLEYVDIISTYENRGYNVYARAPQSAVKSVLHQHTHLIKTVGPAKRFVFLLRKPYIRFIL